MNESVGEYSEEERCNVKRRQLFEEVNHKVSVKKLKLVAIGENRGIDLKRQKNVDIRCFQCKKKLLPYLRFTCKCGNRFCPLHRFFDKHNCPYDYKKDAMQKIAKENPKVAPSKIRKI